MWDIFRTEAEEKLQELEDALLDIESQGVGADNLGAMYRAIHTFKGNSRIMGLQNLENLAHHAEDLMGLVRDHHLPLDEGLGQIFFQVLDAFRDLVSKVAQTQSDVEPQDTAALQTALQQALGHYQSALSEPVNREETPEPPEEDFGFLDIYLEMITHDQSALQGYLQSLLEGETAAQDNIEMQLEAWLLATENLDNLQVLNHLQEAEHAFSSQDYAGFQVALNAFYESLDIPTQPFIESPSETNNPPSIALQSQAADFFQTYETELILISEGVQGLLQQDDADKDMVIEALNSLLNASQAFHFVRLESVLEILLAAFSQDSLDDAEMNLLTSLELGFFQELTAIHESLNTRYPETSLEATHFLSVFQQWHANQLVGVLTQLRRYLSETSSVQTSRVAAWLKKVYPACVFYELHDAGELCLVLEDLYLRTEHASQDMNSLTLQCCDALNKALENPDTLAEDHFQQLIQLARRDQTGETHDANYWIQKLQLHSAFAEVLTSGNLQEIEQAAAKGLHFYVTQVNLNAHQELSAPFYSWLEDDLIQCISNITLYKDTHSEFQFLICSLLTLQEMNASLVPIDPQRRILLQEVTSPTGQKPQVSAASQDAPLPQPEQQLSTRNTQVGGSNLLKVPIDKVNRLMDLAGEIGLAAGAVLSHSELQDLNLTGFHIQAQNLMNLIRELQGETSSLRLVPISVVFKRMERLIRDLKHSTHKDVELILLGETTEIDKMMVDKLYDPLVHMIRNAVDHGIETPNEREALGKPRTGRLVLNAMHQAGEVVISLSDDGRGLDREAILERALEQGLIEEGQELDEAAVFDLIFQPGFSTAKTLSHLSGRGVGMDVVKHTMTELRGRYRVKSEAQKGTQISLHLPLTLAFIEGMIIEVQDTRYAIPIEAVHEVFKVDMKQVKTLSSERTEVLKVRDELIPTCWLEKFYDHDEGCQLDDEKVIVVTQTSRGNLAIPVDRLVGNQQVTLKPLTGILKNIRAGAGYGLLSSGDVAIVLDCERLRAS